MMKCFCLTLFVALGGSTYAQQSGWTWAPQTSSTNQYLQAIHFANADMGWAVGSGGVILRTTNGGVSWVGQTSGQTQLLFSVFFDGTETGWAVGSGGTILRTTNSGVTWTAQVSGTTQALTSVHFTDADTGWAVGLGGTILHTLDGGVSWVAQSSGTRLNLQALHFVDDRIGWAVGNSGMILRTTDGGVAWHGQSSGATVQLNSAHFVDADTGWVVGDGGTILRTMDGGESWHGQSSGTAVSLNAVHFIDADTGWVVGDGGTILRTTDGGVVWVPQSSGTMQALSSVHFINASKGWTAGVFGTILLGNAYSLKLTSPVSGEIWRRGTVQPVTWSSFGVNNVQLQYSVNNGVSWANMALSAPAATGRYLWTVPSIPSTQGRIRIRNAVLPADAWADTSAGSFTIYDLTLSNPNGGQVYGAGTTQNITWNSTDIAHIRLEYSLDAGATWQLIADSLPANPASKSWEIPSIPTTQARVRVSAAGEPSYNAISNSNFTISRHVALYRDTILTGPPSYVNIAFHALDVSGRGVDNLSLDEFRVEENNAALSPSESQLQIANSGQLSSTLKTILLIDNSASIGGDLPVLKEAAIGFIRRKLPDQQIAVYVFSTTPVLLQDFTTDTTALKNAINGITLGFNTTNLYGSILAALGRWENAYSLTHVDQGVLVVFSDGDDTQASSTLDQVLAARGNKQIITMGWGNEINPAVLQQIGNGGYYQVSNPDTLIRHFATVQQNLIRFTRSFYWINYISPKRGNSTQTLRVSLNSNLNTTSTASFTSTFSSAAFYSVLPGILVNPTIDTALGVAVGVDTVTVPANSVAAVTITSPFVFLPQPYQFQVADTARLKIQSPQGGGACDSTGICIFRGTAQAGQVTQVTITKGGYQKVLHVRFSEPVSLSAATGVPMAFALNENMPNPFQSTTHIRFRLGEASSDVSLRIYSLRGELIATLVRGPLASGSHELTFDASRLPGGVYVARLQAGKNVAVRRMLRLN